jgi:hypothetical protein
MRYSAVWMGISFFCINSEWNVLTLSEAGFYLPQYSYNLLTNQKSRLCCKQSYAIIVISELTHRSFFQVMIMIDHFEILVLLARPAAGKSEVIHYLKNLPAEERLERFHIGDLLELDDFPMLWTWFEEDDLLQRMGHPRLHTNVDGYFIAHYLWNLLIQRIGLDYQKLLRDQPNLHRQHTLLVEFSRGKEHGGYTEAFKHIPTDMAAKMSILFLQVSWEESLRKNRKRFNPAKPDSILEHGLSDDKMERLYKEND